MKGWFSQWSMASKLYPHTNYRRVSAHLTGEVLRKIENTFNTICHSPPTLFKMSHCTMAAALKKRLEKKSMPKISANKLNIQYIGLGCR